MTRNSEPGGGDGCDGGYVSGETIEVPAHFELCLLNGPRGDDVDFASLRNLTDGASSTRHVEVRPDGDVAVTSR